MNSQFLPTDYVAPRSNASYTKLMNGTNKLRILSSPILGWEDWIDNKPVRYRMDDKPSQWHDPSRAGKHFWSMIVWNYQEERIQILNLTQGSIRKALEQLYNESDWGAPFFYDVKITREGEGLKTKYTVNPSPHKKLDPWIRKAFDASPCNLEAIFSSSDPFEACDRYTHGVFSDDEPKKEGTDIAFASDVKNRDELGQKCTQKEFDSFLDVWATLYDRDLLITYIEKRSTHFEVDPKETVFLLMNDQTYFEMEFKNWAEKYQEKK